MLKRKDYPKELLIGNEIYKIKFVRKMTGQPDNVVGDCCPSDKEIRILMGQTPEDTLKTFIHELCHAALEFEGDIEVQHELIYKIEHPIYQFICDNLLNKRHKRVK
jgi:hypothetical protein